MLMVMVVVLFQWMLWQPQLSWPFLPLRVFSSPTVVSARACLAQALQLPLEAASSVEGQ